MNKRNQYEFTNSKLIVCEGPSDIAFVRAVIRKFELPEVCIRYTSIDGSGPGGIDKFGTYLSGIRAFPTFPNLSDILLIADNDLTPDDNFKKLIDQIDSVPDDVSPQIHYTSPTCPMQKSSSKPSITIMMIPATGVAGTLETLCLKAAQDASPDLANATNDFATATGVDLWPENTLKDKMKLRSIMAAGYKNNPCITFGRLLEKDTTLIPLDHDSLNHIVDAISTFCST